MISINSHSLVLFYVKLLSKTNSAEESLLIMLVRYESLNPISDASSVRSECEMFTRYF